MSTRVITHKGKSILYIDYTKAKNQDEMIAVLHEAVDYFKKSPKRVRSLSNMSEAFMGLEYMVELKRVTPISLAPNAHKAAIIGIDPLKSILMKGYNSQNMGDIKIFDTEQQALDYLTS